MPQLYVTTKAGELVCKLLNLDTKRGQNTLFHTYFLPLSLEISLPKIFKFLGTFWREIWVYQEVWVQKLSDKITFQVGVLTLTLEIHALF